MRNGTPILQIAGRTYTEAQLVAAVCACEALYEAFAQASEENSGGSRGVSWEALNDAWDFSAAALPIEQRFEINARCAEVNGAVDCADSIADYHRAQHAKALEAASLSRSDGAAHARLMAAARVCREYFRAVRARDA